MDIRAKKSLTMGHPKIHTVFVLLLSVCSTLAQQLWQTDRPRDMPAIADLEVMCGKQHMEVQLTFDKPFNGIVFSKGAVDQYNCIYVKPQTGQSTYKFDIIYDQCGTKPDLNGKFYENNIVIQYDKDLIEVWDEAKRLRCEWYNDYEKGVTKPPIRVSDLEVVELNFRGDNVDCWMEIQQGKGPWASPVNGIVPLGTTLTMVVGIDDKEGEFDMRVKSCEASDGANRPIQLSDENGCVLRPKMISKFMKMRSTDSRATVVTYAFFHAFKFPDSMAVHIRCKVEICRYGCPDHCASSASYGGQAREQDVSSSLNGGYQQAPQAAQPQINTPPLTSYQSGGQSTYQAAPKVSLPQPPSIPDLQTKLQQIYAAGIPRQTYQSGPVGPNPGPNKLPPPPPPPPVPQRKRQVKNPAINPRIPNKRPQQNRPAPNNNRPAPNNNRQPLPRQSRNPGPPRPPHGSRYAPPLPQPAPLRSEPREQPEQAAEKSGGIADFLGLKLPELPKLPTLPFFRSEEAQEKVESEAIPVSLGRTPNADDLKPQVPPPSAVPVLRTANKGQPLVFPSGFNSAGRPVKPIEEAVNLQQSGGPIPYGPRSLSVPLDGEEPPQRRRRSPAEVLSRSERSADIGVQSRFEVVSEVDLDFVPDEQEQETIAVFQGRMKHDDDVVYGICLPATGFSALFVVLSLVTVISVIVSAFVCYHRQIQKAAEEGAPKPAFVEWTIGSLMKNKAAREQQLKAAAKAKKANAMVPPPLQVY